MNRLKSLDMSFLSDNVIPGNHGKIFGTNATTNYDLQRIRIKLLSLDGIKEVHINAKIFPKEFNIHTSKLVTVKDIEDIVLTTGYHAIPKDLFTL
jgi:hypothetical protein